MKISSIRTKELTLLESMSRGVDSATRQHLRTMHENFVVPYNNYLNGIARRLDEAELTPDQITKLFGTVAQGAQAAGGNETMLGKLLPDSIKQKFADSLPPADAGEVAGFEEKATQAVQQVQDPATKQSLMQLIKTGLQNPVTQKLIISGVQGIAGVAAGALTGGLGGKLGATAAGAITGGLVGLVAAKLQGQDWKSAAKAGLKGAAVGGAGGLLGSLASGAAGAAMDSMKGGSDTAPLPGAGLSVGQELPDGEVISGLDSSNPNSGVTITKSDGSTYTVSRDTAQAMTGQQGVSTQATSGAPVSQGASGDAQAGAIEPRGGYGAQEKINQMVQAKVDADYAAQQAQDTGIGPRGGYGAQEKINQMVQAKVDADYAAQQPAIGSNFDAGIAPIGPDGTPMKAVPMDEPQGGPTAGGVPVGSTEPGINRLTGKPVSSGPTWDEMTPDQQAAVTARQQQQAADAAQGSQNAKQYWASKPAYTRSIGRESIDRDLTIRTWALNESLGKPRGGVHLTEAGVGDLVGKIGSWLKTKGQNLTQNVTADKLTQAWNKAGKPTDSEKIAELLKQQGVDPAVVSSAYQSMGIPATSPAATPAQSAAPAADTRVEPTMEPAAPAAEPTEPTQTTQAPAQSAAPAQAGGTGIFADPQKLAASFQSYLDAGGSIRPQMRGVLKDILLTALRTVESRQRKINKIVKEAKTIQGELDKIKKQQRL